MKKSRKLPEITIYINSDPNPIPLYRVDSGEYFGDIKVCGATFWVNAIRVRPNGNALYRKHQIIIDDYAFRNVGFHPAIIYIGKKGYYVFIKPAPPSVWSLSQPRFTPPKTK